MWSRRVVLLAVLGLGACGPGPEDGELEFTAEEGQVVSSEAGLMRAPPSSPRRSLQPAPPAAAAPGVRTPPPWTPECTGECPGLPQDPIPLNVLRPSPQPRLQLVLPAL